METNTESNQHLTQSTTKNQMSVIAYITIIGLIIAIIDNKDKKNDMVSFHIRQSAGLFVASIALFIISLIPILGWIIWFVGIFVLLFMWITGIVNALKPIKKPLPLLGNKFEEWLKETF